MFDCSAVLLNSRVVLIPLEPLSRFGDKPLMFRVICSHSGTEVLKKLKEAQCPAAPAVSCYHSSGIVVYTHEGYESWCWSSNPACVGTGNPLQKEQAFDR